ncbi:MAG: GNAT family N-acetyltransferase, partial [Acidobacteriota bacterium]|nr:GNAT family N-acetyltransferase [Acidobacteriota bacterium]
MIVFKCYVSPAEVEIVQASGEDLHLVRTLWREYWRSLRLAPDFQSFADELRTLPGPYALPKGRLLIARLGGRPAGTVALRPLTEQSCEAKRMYVR